MLVLMLHFQAQGCFAMELPRPNQSLCVSERTFPFQPTTHQLRHKKA